MNTILFYIGAFVAAVAGAILIAFLALCFYAGFTLVRAVWRSS